MASTAAYIRSFTKMQLSMSDIMARTNSMLEEETDAGKFVTLIMVQISQDGRTVEYVNAGHPSGYVLSSTGHVKARLENSAFPLAVLDDVEFPTSGPVKLDPGDILLLLTDGVYEAMSCDQEQFGMERTLEVIRENRHRKAEEIVGALFETVSVFSGRATQEDDFTAVVIKVESTH
jgi:sigma-B regulation protein RsbU (phosphoserine phosphatase)